MAQTKFDKQVEESAESLMFGIARVLAGRDLDGVKRTDATFWHSGTRILPKVEGKVRRRSYKPGWRRLSFRVALGAGVVETGYLSTQDLDATVRGVQELWDNRDQALAALESGGIGAASVLTVGSAAYMVLTRERRELMREWVAPLHDALYRPLGYAEQTDPRRYLHIPKNFSDDDAEIRIDLPKGLGFSRDVVADLITQKLALEGVTFDWHPEGSKPYVRVKKTRMPPAKALFKDPKVRELVTKAPESAPIIGIGSGNRIVSVDLDADSPHILVNASTGGGKSATLRCIACQMLHHGSLVFVLDTKRISHPWAHGIDGVTYCRDIADIHDQLIELGQLGRLRTRIADELGIDADPKAIGPRVLILLEEINATMKQLARYWEKIRESGDPKVSPAVDALNEILYMGRQLRMHVLLVAQSATARALGGPEVREQFATRILARYSMNAWRMLAPEVHPAPKSTKHHGRAQVVIGGSARETQVLFFTETEAREWATTGKKATDAKPAALPTQPGPVQLQKPPADSLADTGSTTVAPAAPDLAPAAPDLGEGAPSAPARAPHRRPRRDVRGPRAVRHGHPVAVHGRHLAAPRPDGRPCPEAEAVPGPLPRRPAGQHPRDAGGPDDRRRRRQLAHRPGGPRELTPSRAPAADEGAPASTAGPPGVPVNGRPVVGPAPYPWPRYLRQEGNVARSSSSSQRRAIEKHLKGIAEDYKRAAKRNPIRVPIQTEATGTGGTMPGRDSAEGDPVLDRLLMWLDEQAQQNRSHHVDVTRFVEEQQLPDEDPSVLAYELEERDLVRNSRGLDDAPTVYLTDAGRAAIHRLKKRRGDRAARLRYTMDAFHRWLFDTAGDQKPINPVLFLATPASYFAGSEITGTELHEALAHLAQHQLIKHIDTEPPTVAITPQGVNCALTGGSVQDHVNQPRPGATYNTYLPNAKGVIIGEQQNFTQNNTDGVDPTLFVQLAGYVGQVSPILGLPDEDRVELERVAQDLHTEATSGNPEPGRLRQFATQLKDKLLEGATTMAATQGIQMAEQALAALM